MPPSGIQVPASPVKKKTLDVEDEGRHVRAGREEGYGKGLFKSTDPSLRKTPSYLNTRDKFSKSARSATQQPVERQPVPKGPSFSERLTSIRTEEAGSVERRKRIVESRTKSFGLGRKDMDDYKARAVDIPEAKPQATTFDRNAVLSQDYRSTSRLQRGSSPRKSGRPGETGSDQPPERKEESEKSFEPYSGFHLSRRYLPHNVVARHVSGKRLLSIKDLLRDVKAPDFSLPDIEQDLVVLAIIANKSEPRSHNTKGGKQDDDRGKYMVMSLCDLEYSIDMFLFNSGFDRFWKLTEGTVVAILNPGVLPPPPGRHDTGRFSLVINSDEDTIIELGSARDLGSCQSIRKDGNPCGSWVNKKRTSFCEFHTNEAVQKTRATRIELNTDGGFGFGPRDQQRRNEWKKDGQWKGKGPKNYDWETKTRYFTTKSMSASDLIDGKGQSAEDKKEREAHLKRSMEKKEREREIMKKLARHGDASGKEYMRLAAAKQEGRTESAASGSQTSAMFPSSSARDSAALASLGLDKKNRDIQLHSGKRKRPDSSGLPESRSSSTLGWGGGLRDKLSRMKEGEKLRKESSHEPPVQKKTRFVTDHGIREAGRASIGSTLSSRQVSLDDGDDDDELVILK